MSTHPLFDERIEAAKEVLRQTESSADKFAILIAAFKNYFEKDDPSHLLAAAGICAAWYFLACEDESGRWN